MSESKLRTQFMDFSVSIINLVRYLKEKRESIIATKSAEVAHPLEILLRLVTLRHEKSHFCLLTKVAFSMCSVLGGTDAIANATDTLSD